MEAARALADLVEISPQIETAVVLGSDGGTLGSVGVSEQSAAGVARTGRALLERAAEFRKEGGRVTQLDASLGTGDVFAVDDGARAIVAVTSRPQAPGLVFYDLKRCLAALAEPASLPEPEAKPRRLRMRRKERDE